MANKLKKMKYTSVDLVRRGANPAADIMLYKSADDGLGGEKSVLKSQGEIFDMTYALYESMGHIISEPKLSEIKKADLLRENLEDFNEVIAKSFDDWSEGKASAKGENYSPARLCAMKDVVRKFSEIIKAEEEKVENADNEDDFTKEERRNEDMAIMDMEKMTPEDKAIFEELQRKYGKKSGSEVHPEVKRALDEVAEIKKSLEMAEMTDIAKKYEVIGKDAAETADVLYELKKSSETAYNSVIAAYDAMVDVQAHSGIFKEYGSSRSVDSSDLSGLVSEIRKSAPDISYESAVLKAFELYPSLDPMTGKLK